LATIVHHSSSSMKREEEKRYEHGSARRYRKRTRLAGETSWGRSI
jgi:hypothetical protein